MKHLISLFIAVSVAFTAFGQSTPPNKLRSNDSFTQVDNYLVAAKRLGIPTGDTPTLNASTTSQNSAKLFYNTTDESLYVYDVVGGIWNPVSADIDLSEYYTIAQVDSAINSKASPFNLIDVTQSLYTDKAINVIAFDNTGMSYSEGSIDFGVTRDSTHTMGLYAFKQGFESSAIGDISSAFGNNNTASGIASTAFGQQTTASGDYSSAFGNNNTASGYASSAFGQQTTASGDYSSAFGNNNTASGIASTAFGDSNTASGYASSAFGLQTEASGDYSAAFGDETTASGRYSSAFGGITTASGRYSAAFGDRSIANDFASLAIGRYSTDGTAQTTWTPGSPIFKVGNGTSNNNKSNAYVLYNDGTSTQYGIASYGADYSANFTDRSLVDKEYVDEQSVIEALDEGNGIGYRIRGRAPGNYGNIGADAVDFSISTTSSSTKGATGLRSFAAGNNTTAQGNLSFSVGTNTIASGNQSAAFGNGTEASGPGSFSAGRLTVSSGDFSFSAGNGTIASGTNSTALGINSEALASGSFAAGSGAVAHHIGSIALGTYTTLGDVVNALLPGNELLKIGNGTGPGNRSNAYVLYNDGRSEQVKDIEVTEIGQGVVLKSPDGNRWRITVDNSGNLSATAL